MSQTITKKRPKHFEAFFEYAAMGIVITNRLGTITAVNPYALKEFGYRLNELIGQKIEILIPAGVHTKHSQHHLTYMDKLFLRRMGIGLGLRALKKDQSKIDVEVSLSNCQVNGERHVIAFINNITSRKKAESKKEKLNNELEATIELRTEELKKRLEKLENSRAALEDMLAFQKAVVDNAGAMIIATDECGVIKLFNPEASINIGYLQSEVIDLETPVLFHNKIDIEQKRKALEKEFGVKIESDFDVLVEKAKRNIHKEEQYTYIKKDGNPFPVSLTISSIKNKDGAITGFLGIAINITERKKAEEILQHSLEKEKDLNELKSAFVSMASHEFRTPLSIIQSSAYLIEEYSNTKDQHSMKKHIHHIISSVNMLTNILNDFLSLSKIEERKINVTLTNFNIKHLVHGIVNEIRSTFQKQQYINYRHIGPVEVFMDQALLKHIIHNLVSNASKFSPAQKSIEIKTACTNDQFLLSVKDHGIGISKDDQQHLMERFFRGANAGNIQGTGLGLHIVSKYAELMQGAVTCKSELDKGTEFTITFTKIIKQP